MSRSSDKEAYRELLDDVCVEYCEPKKYCILKEFLVSLHASPRLLLQIKCVEKFKYEKSKELDKDVGWAVAFQLWADEGYAKKFADIYEEGIRFNILYRKVRNGNK